MVGVATPIKTGCTMEEQQYTTLGPKFYIFSVLSPRICFCFVNPYFLAGIASFCEILLLAVSKHVLKRLNKMFFSAQIDFSAQIYFFHELLPPEGD